MAGLLARRMASLGTENAFKLGEDIQRCVARGLDVLRLNLGEPDFDTPEHVNREAIAQIEAGNSHYCDPAGLLGLRQAICRRVERTRGLAVDPARVIVTTGAKPPIGFTFQTYVEPGDEVIYPSPGFPIYESWAGFIGARAVPLQLSEESGFAFTPEDLGAKITPRTKIIILCSPSNPTGGVLSRELLAGVAALVRERCRPETRVYSDEIYEDILFDGEILHSIASEPGMAERTIVVSGMSKGFAMTGWRLGWAVLPTAEEAACFKQLNINTISCVPPFVQEAGREAYDSPASAAAVARMVEAFRARRDWIVPALNAVPGVTCQLPKGAFYVFPNVAGLCERLGTLAAYERLAPASRARTSPAGMLQMFLLYRHGLAVMDRASFGRLGSEGQHYLRLSIAASLEQLQEGVRRLAAAAEDASGFASFLEEERLWETA
jgi:aspartate/methionine/tyrosine aminotransferase